MVFGDVIVGGPELGVESDDEIWNCGQGLAFAISAYWCTGICEVTFPDTKRGLSFVEFRRFFKNWD